MIGQDTTTRLRTLAGELRDRQQSIVDLEERLKQENDRIRAITAGEMVDLMNEADVRSFEIESDGNMPAMSFELGNHYAGSIPVKWEEQRREAAFAQLPDELIKITVKAIFAKGEAHIAQDLAEDLVTAGYTVQLEKTVHASTLKSWLRETFEGGGLLPDLETIGASIFPEVKVKEIE
ncbi:MAG TPA: hypothetical protein VH593_07505 [Ktedonobacteraceae bacterium]